MLEVTTRPKPVPGPAGPLTIDDLPSPTATYWVARRKADLLAAIDGRLIGLIDACAKYRLSGEELESWRRTLDRAGIPGLCATETRIMRKQIIGQTLRHRPHPHCGRCPWDGASRLVPLAPSFHISGISVPRGRSPARADRRPPRR
ncbi:MAG TPA: DUF1153 domain-containing protein [Sphingopyxis sp.]|nr:DUF1153 domain-containing protein [Sphingopyxis sp.]